MDIEARYCSLLKKSGLTGGQVARATGAGSPRSFYRDTLPPRQLQAFEILEKAVDALEASTPSGRRDLILDSSSGPSILRKLIDAAPKSQRIQWPPYSLVSPEFDY